MITSLDKLRAAKRQQAAAFRARHGAAWTAYHRDWTQRQRRDQRIAKGRQPTPHDLALPAEPIPCPSAP